MIYIFHGPDTLAARTKARDLIASLQKKKPDALHMRITENEWNENTLAEVIGSQGLFSEKLIVQFDNLLDTDASESIVSSLGEIAKSQNIFVIIESNIDSKTFKQLEKYAEKIQEYGQPKEKEWNSGLFSLADAYGKRDKKMLWVEFQKAKKTEAAHEEIHGILFWQHKSMLLASKTELTESGLKPFVYNKSKTYAKNFSEKELKDNSTKLVAMYHDAHRGLMNFSSALEAFALEI